MNYPELYKATNGKLVFGRLEYSARHNLYDLINDKNHCVSIFREEMYKVVSADEYIVTLTLVLFDENGNEKVRDDNAPCIVLCKKEAQAAFFPQFFAVEPDVNEYTVVIREVLEAEITIGDARNEEHALKKAREMYSKGEIVIDADRFKGADIFIKEAGPNTIPGYTVAELADIILNLPDAAFLNLFETMRRRQKLDTIDLLCEYFKIETKDIALNRINDEALGITEEEE
jgi:hypothetical protein